jgi:hypothetical protein
MRQWFAGQGDYAAMPSPPDVASWTSHTLTGVGQRVGCGQCSTLRRRQSAMHLDTGGAFLLVFAIVVEMQGILTIRGF